MQSPRLVAAVLLIAVGLTQAKFDIEGAKARFEKCKNETGAEETFEQVVEKHVMPTSDKGICLIECIMKANNFYSQDGEYDKEAVLKYMKNALDGTPNADSNYEKLETIVQDCSKIDVEGLDKCEKAVKHSTCVKVKAEKENIRLTV